MEWQEYKGKFAFDGSWRDIYVLGTDAQDWQRLIDFFRSGAYKFICKVDGQEGELPLNAREIFEVAHELKPFLSVDVGGVTLNCHFFVEEEIEFDLDPREVRSELEAEQIFVLMRQVGQMLGKEVVFTEENAPDGVIFRFHPDTDQVEYISSVVGPW